MKPRKPRRRDRFCWSCAHEFDVIVYRLFRRDHDGRMHHTKFTFYPGMARADVAAILNQARHALRDRVDEIDLKAMGVL